MAEQSDLVTITPAPPVFKTTVVEKLVEPDVDLGNLIIVDRDPPEAGEEKR
jgi:hydroxylamine reductase (hybrid-cluster protein)